MSAAMLTVLAHGLGGRSDLPVPILMAMYGAGGAVIASFVGLGALWTHARLRGGEAGVPVAGAVTKLVDAPATRVVLRALGVLFFAGILLVALLGPADAGANPAPTWLFVWFWVGLVPLSLVFGPVWRVLNPLRAVTAGLARLTGDPQEQSAKPVPARIGHWPAAAGLLVFVWIELVYDAGSAPLTVVVFLAAYSVVHLCAALVYGQAWYAKADGFEVYSTLVGHLSPLGRRDDGTLVWRNPLDGLAALRFDTSLLAVVYVLLGSTAFDGLTRTRFWTELVSQQSRAVYLLTGTAGLLGAVAFVAVTYSAATRVVARTATHSALRGEAATMATRFGHSLVPIVVGYTIAHYFSFLLFQGQAGYILASDPFGTGANLFGTSDWTINYTLVSSRTIALVQVGAIVMGHILGVVAAHDRAVGLFKGRDKTDAQYPLLAVMVLYTVGGIFLLVGG